MQLRRWSYYILRIAAALGGIVVFFLGDHALASKDYKTVFLCWTIAGLCSGLFAATDHLHTDAKVKWSRDLTPAELMSAMIGRQFKYCLVLRPFSADARIKMKNTLNPFVSIGISFGMPFLDVQEWIVRYSPSNWRFFSWGGTIGAIRPIRIVSKDNWFDDLTTIAKLADVVILIPGSSYSIARELDFLIQELTHRSVIVFPPRNGNERLYLEVKDSERFRDFLPKVPEEGCFFLPFKDLTGALAFASYPLNVKTFVRVLEARQKATEA
jgi:hypothetical protein